jgi:hypothetical protein
MTLTCTPPDPPGAVARFAGKGRSDYGERPIESLAGPVIGANVGSMTAALWDEWAEMSVTHRDVRDPDVAAVLRLVQREAEIDRLRRQGRL